MAVDVYEAARFESLWERFESVVAAPLDDPLDVETVVVPGRGWSNWMARRLAVSLGCWSGFRCLSAGQWMSETLETLLGPELAPRRESDALTWFVASELPGLLDDDTATTDIHGIQDFYGIIEELRVWDRVLPQEELNGNIKRDQGLLSGRSRCSGSSTSCPPPPSSRASTCSRAGSPAR